jgi:8-oxo-dGTP pyrophosphatase MutT (NUDIX family)
MASQTRTVRAAGGVVFREQVGRLEVLLIATHGNRRWSLPKGRIERGENAETAAVREVLEETGALARVVAPLETVEYYFFAQRTRRFHKFVEYFVMAYESGVLVPQASEVDAAEWVGVEEARTRLSYPNDRKLLEKGVSLWQQHYPAAGANPPAGDAT